MRLTATTFPWADGTDHTFDLPLKQVRVLQEKTGLGPNVLAYRLASGEWKVDDYRETILQGLIGGGMSAADAGTLVRQYVDERPAKESLLPAQAILLSFINGAPQPKKAKGAKTAATPATGQAGSTSSNSTASVPSSDSLPAT